MDYRDLGTLTLMARGLVTGEEDDVKTLAQASSYQHDFAGTLPIRCWAFHCEGKTRENIRTFLDYTGLEGNEPAQ